MPLTVWMYRSGFCRFSTQRYNSSLSAKDLENSFVHLTNVAIQKKSETYSEDTGGGKWDVRALKLHLMSRYGASAVDVLFRDIHMLILRSLFSVQQVGRASTYTPREGARRFTVTVTNRTEPTAPQVVTTIWPGGVGGGGGGPFIVIGGPKS